jgi:Ca2+-binding RTX toxin-like protein
VTASLLAGVLQVQGTAGNDVIVVRQINGEVVVAGNGIPVAAVPVNQVSRIDVFGQGGDDRIDINSGQAVNEQLLQIAANIYGGAGNDTLVGGTGPDMLSGGTGNDLLFAGTGNSTLYGDTGDDTVVGGPGSDYLYGGAGNDSLTAGSGNTYMDGGSENDTLIGGPGADTLLGGADSDWLEPHSANSVVNGGTGFNINPYRWTVDGTQPTDIQQQGTNSCVILAELASASAQGVDLADRISYLGNYVFQVQLYDARISSWVNVKVTFNGTLSQDAYGFLDPTPRTGDPATGVSEFWPLLYQRAYLQYFYKIDPMNTAALRNFGGELFHDQAASAITGWSTTTAFWNSGSSMTTLAQQMQGFLAHGDVLTVGGAGHAYAVLNVFQVNGLWRVTLYNPYGTDSTPTPLAVDQDGANDGVITMDFATLFNSFVMYNRAIKPNG